MTHKITLELTDEDFETLESYVKKCHKGITIEEYLTNTISFYLRGPHLHFSSTSQFL